MTKNLKNIKSLIIRKLKYHSEINTFFLKVEYKDYIIYITYDYNYKATIEIVKLNNEYKLIFQLTENYEIRNFINLVKISLN